MAKFISRVSVVFKGNWDWSKYSLEYVEQQLDAGGGVGCVDCCGV